DAIAALQQKGVKVICHFEDAGGKGLLACSGADKILLTPAGGIRFAGLRSQSMYFGEGLRKLGIEPDFIRIKEHKSAPESFVREGPTEQAAKDTAEFLAGVESIYLDRLSRGRKLTPAQIKIAIAKGPFVADEAIAAGFADAKAFDDEIGKHVREVVGEYVRVEEDDPQTQAPKAFGTLPRIAVVYLDGDIVDGRSQQIPLIGEKMAGSYTIADALKEAREDPNIKGVVLRIESPGGSSLASDIMWREAELLYKSGKPIVVSMGSVAASGGYYAAAFGAPIYADAATVTGSIGIFYGKADVSGLLGKLGIHVVTQKTAPKADAESFYRPFTDEERIELEEKVGKFYSVFLDRVSRGRKMTVEQVDAVGHGKVWLGSAAKKQGLVDFVGGFEAAFADIRAQTGLDPDVAVQELPIEKNGILDLVLGLMGAEAPPPSVASLPKMLGIYARAMVPFIVYAPDEPLALWEGLEAP
ncbi:MAG: signal peptide peptidase SppA, partial [Polyangiales bacterium]